MSMLRPAFSRRDFLVASALATSGIALTGCRHGMKIFKDGTLETPPGVPSNSSLTIDVHCHIFNGTDLQIKEFVGDITFPTWWGKAAGDILERVNWKIAPKGDKEKAKLERLLKGCKTEGKTTKVSGTVKEMLDQHRKEGFALARKAVLEIQQKEAAGPAPRVGVLTANYINTQEAKRQIYESFAEPNYERFLQRLNSPPPLTDTMKTELAAAHVLEAVAPCGPSVANSTAQPFSLKGAAQFIVQYFQYRYVSAQDYLNTFTPKAQRDVDLMLASMVDYDWWLAKGHPTPTSLETQVAVMEMISILSDGRVHGFAPFCPLREVAARAGFKHDGKQVTKSSLDFVQDAVRNHGCVGVKLYPPMGFAAYGNAMLDEPLHGNPNFWKSSLLPCWASKPISYPDGTTKRLGERLDDALDCLYQWCVDEQVPILAHTDETNGPTCAYKELAQAEYWAKAFAQHPDLRVNFGHLGGIDNSIESVTLPPPSKDFALMLGATGSKNAYGDAAFSSNIVLKPSNFGERIETAYEQSQGGQNQMPSHLLYGTDWSLLEQIGNNEEYMKGFEDLFSHISGTPRDGHSAEDCFFGWNAVEYLGLRGGTEGKNARSRLDAFYAKHCMPQPVWIQKLANS